MKLHVRNKNNFICGRADITKAIDANTDKPEDYKKVHDKWAEVFEKEAKLIVGEQYDFRKIKGKKDLEQFYNWMVELEVAKAMVYAHKKFEPDVLKKVRTDVDELTAKLGMAPSTLGWIYNHPEDKPKDEGKKKKQKTEASSSRAPAKINLPKRPRAVCKVSGHLALNSHGAGPRPPPAAPAAVATPAATATARMRARRRQSHAASASS